jgi:predicted N-formylglutamate amidohydrolase
MPKAHHVSVVLTCEHAGNQIPQSVKPKFAESADVLISHRGWDPGALPLAKRFSTVLNVPLAFSTVSRLVVELNRSLNHPKLFSEFTCNGTQSEKQVLLNRYWHPHRDSVTKKIESNIRDGNLVVHLSVHTFTEHFYGEVRTTDIGLLYDPRRQLERELCAAWKENLLTENPAWNVRRNDPYKGNLDGFTTALRKQCSPSQYLGIELEVCQKFFLNGGGDWKEILTKLPRSFATTLRTFSETRLQR